MRLKLYFIQHLSILLKVTLRLCFSISVTPYCVAYHKTAYRTIIHIAAKTNGSRKASSHVVENFQIEFCLSSNCFRYSGKCSAQTPLRLWRMNRCFAYTYIHSNVRNKPEKMTGILIPAIGELLDASIPTTARSTDSATTKEFTKLLKIVITHCCDSAKDAQSALVYNLVLSS